MKRTTLAALGVAAFLTSSTQVAFAAKSPQEFIKDAIQGDNSEIMLGQLAQQKGGEKVKTFGQTLVTDHTLAKQQAGDVAKTLGVAPPSDPMTEAKDEEAKLSRMSGKDFDREFAAYMVTDHKKDIAEFQDQASANNGSASALAAKQIPVLKQHLQMAEAIATSGSASTSSSQTMASALAQEGPDMWRASKLSGVNVYGPNNQKVGGVTDVLMGKDGKAEYIVIGVGGFLGLGQKDVALPFDQVHFTDEPRPLSNGGNGGVATGTAVAPGAAGGVGIAPNTAVGLGGPVGTTTGANASGATGMAAAPTGASAAANRSTAYPDHGTIDMTADQLKAAPTFQFAK